MTREYMPVRVEWKAADDSNVLDGYASVFDVTDLHGDIVKRGAFRKTIKERVAAGRVKLLDSHVPDSSHVIGTVVEAKEDEHGLRIRARLSSAPSAQDLKVKLLEGHLEYLSIGYSTVKESWHRNDGKDMVRHLEELKLFEVSVVPFPANEEAAISAVKEAIRVAGSGLVEAPVEERKQLAEDLSDTLGGVFEEPVTLIVGKSADEVKAALAPSDDAAQDETDDPDEVETKESADEAEHEESPDEPEAEKPSLKEIMRRAAAVLDGRDPNEVAEPTQVASLTARLELEERMLRDQMPTTDREEAS